MVKPLKKKPALELWSKLTQAYDMVRKGHTKLVTQHKLTVPQFGVLEVLHENESMPLKKLANYFWLQVQILHALLIISKKKTLFKEFTQKRIEELLTPNLRRKGNKKLMEYFQIILKTFRA